MVTPDERCARCGDPLPGANPDDLDVCVPCDTIVSLEVERDELLAAVARQRAKEIRVRHLAAGHKRIAALQTDPERLVMVPAITVAEDILAALMPP